ncbi:short-chain dehydrogenase, partial [bacterium SM23_57]
EERPSRVLLSKSAIAGAHSMLLFLMGRTPDAPFTKEIKPAAAIAWKKIAYGEISKGGKPIQLYDCNPDQAEQLADTFNREADGRHEAMGETLKSVFVDTGENGIFSLGEFYTISALGQMEYVTPEEIAQCAFWEIKGGNTGTDIISSLDNAIMGPTYRAGYLREAVLQKMKALGLKHGVESVAFELLGPPRLSKLLHEADLLRKGFETMERVMKADPEELSEGLESLIRNDRKLRSKIISIGIPILLKDGKTLLRGPMVKIPPYRGSNELAVTPESIEDWTSNGWVDLRPTNMKRWQDRFKAIREEIDAIPADDTSSRYHRDREYWVEDPEIHIGKVVSWIFITEEQGLRIKS